MIRFVYVKHYTFYFINHKFTTSIKSFILRKKWKTNKRTVNILSILCKKETLHFWFNKSIDVTE